MLLSEVCYQQTRHSMIEMIVRVNSDAWIHGVNKVLVDTRGIDQAAHRADKIIPALVHSTSIDCLDAADFL